MSNRVVLDPEAFLEHEDSGMKSDQKFCCYCQICVTPLNIIDISGSERSCTLAPTKVDTYILATREWARLPFSLLGEISYHDVLDRIQLNKNIKDSLKLEIMGYLDKRKPRYDKSKVLDIINGRSPSGPVFHLHGKQS